MANKKHISRLAAPKNWPIKRKERKWIARPNPGAHPLEFGMPIVVGLKEMLKYAKTTREVKKILNDKKALVDGRVIKDKRFPIGVMDILSFPSIDNYYRLIINKLGKFSVVKIDKKQANLKVCKIKGKTSVKKGLTQINLHDNKNILVKDGSSYKVGDSLILDLEKYNGKGKKEDSIKKHLSFKKDALIYIYKGKYSGLNGIVGLIEGNKVIVKTGNNKFETLKKYIFVIYEEISLK